MRHRVGLEGAKAVEVGVEEQQRPPVQAQAFPHPVAHRKPGVEDRHHGLPAGQNGAVEIKQDGLIARVGLVVLAAGHIVSLQPDGYTRGALS
jgi:hypothetical protein